MFLEFLETFAGISGNKLGEPEHDRNDQQGGQCQPTVEDEHGNQDPDHRQDAGKQGGHILGDSLVNGVDVIGQPAHQLASRVAVEECDRQRLQVREQVLAHLLQRPLGYAGHDPVGDGLEQVVQ